MGSKFWFVSTVCIGFSVWEVALAQRIAELKCQEFINSYTEMSFIVGGQEAQPNEFPHQAVLEYAKVGALNVTEFLCGGSLISERYVLTAAHCSKPRIVRLGEHNLDDDKDGQQDFNVASFTRHPRYNRSYSYHDIALVELTQVVLFNDRIRPACLWTSVPFNMSSVIASGFGRTSNNNKLMSSKLKKVKLNIFDGDFCNKTFPYDMLLKDGLLAGQLCVGSMKGGNDTCNGDSGGPLQVTLNMETCVYHIVGLTSFGSPSCGNRNSAAVYTQVASYLDWIEQVVWKNEYYMTV